ncbi:hypothetical protein XA68_14454 [Ophiocordyceps unilateralis]|uniref:Extracellular membrane protein CFEM domain-containing protein n=1 Tax=Ophiocordyceps unilateralis TaxID=268505 RepID=A0A2A9PAF9_OPHUN|nr:hypothetical protein XA68_14454 [Ophiocordyceps unilateralis]
MSLKAATLIAMVAAATGALGDACQKKQEAWDHCSGLDHPETYGLLRYCLCEKDEGLFHQAWQCTVEQDADCQRDTYWRLYYIDFKARYCEDQYKEFNGNFAQAFEDHYGLWGDRLNKTKF